MSDVLTTTSRVLTADGNSDPYDHEISLIDTTAPKTARTRSPSPARRRLGRISTKGSLKDQYTRLKYAKYQENRYSKGSSINTNEDEEAIPAEPQSMVDAPPTITEGEAIDFAETQPKQKAPQQPLHPAYEIDVLYENERGAFLFGIPLYSHSSLLNFDPAPWVNKEFKDSPVNITNAQVPDPTWEWTWKTWYVDMSYDVDEEGWQYSFAFGKKFAWHGTHPWFHSFVRRRRWLRKRVKKSDHLQTGKAGTMKAAHKLTAEYFTIHPKRDQSPSSRRPESYVSHESREVEEPPDEVKDIATLLRALRLATVDRQKIDMVKKFVDSAGEELAYLGEYIPDIMSFLVFQNSKRYLLEYLKTTANEAQQHREEHDAEDRPEGEAERRRIDSLLSAVEAADKQINGLEYWSDRKHVLKTTDTDEVTQMIATIFDEPAPKPNRKENPVEEIKGISQDAELGGNPTHEFVHRTHASRDEKGKGKEKERGHDSEDDTVEVEEEEKKQEEGSPPRLKGDQVLIPDE